MSHMSPITLTTTVMMATRANTNITMVTMAMIQNMPITTVMMATKMNMSITTVTMAISPNTSIITWMVKTQQIITITKVTTGKTEPVSQEQGFLARVCCI